MKTIYDTLNADDTRLVRAYSAMICKCDPAVSQKFGSIMSNKQALVFVQEQVFKYGLARTKSHFSFHSMVMYAHPDIKQLTESLLESSKAKIQKGCINFKSSAELSLPVLEEIVKASAARDFSDVIAHYKKKS